VSEVFSIITFLYIFKNYPNYMKHQKLVQISENTPVVSLP